MGATVGILLFVIALAVAVSILVYYFWRKSKQKAFNNMKVNGAYSAAATWCDEDSSHYARHNEVVTTKANAAYGSFVDLSPKAIQNYSEIPYRDKCDRKVEEFEDNWTMNNNDAYTSLAGQVLKT